MIHEIPYLQFREFESGMQQQVQGAALRVLERGNYVLGEELQTFENAFASYLGNDVEVVGVGNGFDALVIGLKALGIGSNDEVIVPSNSYMATVNAVLQVGAKPILAEPDPLTYNLKADSVERVLSPKTKAILPVHLYGQTCEMEPLMLLAQKYGLKVIEDAAQAHGAFYHDKYVGTLGDVAAFSFYPTKNLGAAGDGGALVSNSKEVTDFARTYRNYGQVKKYIGEIVGVNSRLDEIQAAILYEKLKYLDQLNAERRRLAEIYLTELRGIGDLILPLSAQGCQHVYHIFNIRVKQRDALKQHLINNGIGTAIHYPVPVHLQPAYSNLGYKPGSLPIAEELANTSLSLPLFPGLTEQEQAYVIKKVKEFY
jgi:dTDP-4-amino-4,6-dideoxygalactose transaminase